MSYLQARKDSIQRQIDEQARLQTSLDAAKATVPDALVAAPSTSTRSKKRTRNGPTTRSFNNKNGKQKSVDEVDLVDSDGGFDSEEVDVVSLCCGGSSSKTRELSKTGLKLLSPEEISLIKLSQSIAKVPSLRNLPWEPYTDNERWIGEGISQRLIQQDQVEAPIDNPDATHDIIEEALNAFCYGASQVSTMLARSRRSLFMERDKRGARDFQLINDRKEALLSVEELKKADSKLENELKLVADFSKEKDKKIEIWKKVVQERDVGIDELKDREESLLSEGFDDGSYHVIRCLKAFTEYCPPYDVLEKWLCTPFDDAKLRDLHPEFPYGACCLEDFKKMKLEWDPPAANKVNLHTIMEKWFPKDANSVVSPSSSKLTPSVSPARDVGSSEAVQVTKEPDASKTTDDSEKEENEDQDTDSDSST